MRPNRGGAERNTAVAVALLAPATLLFLTFVVFPVVQAGYYAVFRWNGIGPPTQFVGLDNFVRMFGDSVFRTALRNTFAVVGASLVIQLPLAFFFALLIGRRRTPGEVVFRVLFFFPYVLADIIAGIVWRFIYHPQFGLPTRFAQMFAGASGEIGLLGNPDVAFFAVLAVILWKYIGFHMILFISGLQGVPAELEDAAVVDGAGTVQVIRFVIIPCIRNTIMISVFLSVIGSLNVFDIVWALGRGGPVNATETLVTYLFNFGFRRFAFGYGSAVAVVIFALCFSFNLLYHRFITGDRGRANQ